MRLTDYIKNWFIQIDINQQNYIASMIMRISPLSKEKIKANIDPLNYFISLLDSSERGWEEVGLCLGLISTIDFLVYKFDDIDETLDKYNEMKEWKEESKKTGSSTNFEDQYLNEAPERFQNQKAAKESWDLLKESNLTMDKIRQYIYSCFIK